MLKFKVVDSDIQSETAHSIAHEPIFGSVYLAAWGKSCSYFAFSQTEVVEVVTWQVWYAQEDNG